MQKFIPAALLAVLVGIVGCEEKGPTDDIGDNIDQVMEKAASQPEPVLDENAARETTPSPEALEQQKEEFQQAIEEASREAEDRLNEILENTLDQE
ncbi:hypothetical protein CGX12_09850 [Zobellella denitrificans]|jgi:division protein CdvB (Snf7/Vps24/ESCRT-III family)|uniref:Uncharacterized protein n=1 Tax=Zobellella denitrificans TaxID=347534 RepID=A0A231N0A5_9GAMM|nr:hypothetical protein [Zobellella denitrificans]ATG73615.1 hypothetical protein AN401_06900 [Zobellella denitrificans]OXS15276.1 hypothetical protein CGX12_09850 [Zobellella denitrificans]